jgi:spermidine synthase
MRALAPARVPHAPLLGLFAVATFLNAGLLFAVEPMFTKMVLPLLGGTPSVWNTCLLFFQGALLAGYLYAHLTSRWLTPARQGALHLALLAASVSLLPIMMPAGAHPPAGSRAPIPWLLGLLATRLGLPFLLLAAGAPLLQRWFATTRHATANNPYRLYVASNIGSFMALMAYPTVIERRLQLSEQSVWWLETYWGLIALLVACAGAAWWWRSADAGDGLTVAEEPGVPPGTTDAGARDEESAADRGPTIVPTGAWRLRWVLLSFAPSSLLLGVTTYLGTDVASVPFLWVVPLALYLLTFVIVFARRPILGRRVVLALQLPLGIALLAVISANPVRGLTTFGMLHLVAFFVTALVLHRELADSRPRAAHLTEYYLWIALGGLLGGVFNVLLAPLLYSTVLEYPFALIIAFGLRPGGRGQLATLRALALDLALPAVLALALLGAHRLPVPDGRWGEYAAYAYVVVGGLIVATFVRRPLRLALGAAALFAATRSADLDDDDTLLQQRSFFGVYQVRRYGEYHLLQNGTTTHGGESMVPARRTEPLTYYHREGPLGDVFATVAGQDVPRTVAVVGLGAGTTACYARPGEPWTYFEIDPLVVRIARAPQLFSYLRDCAPNARIVLGDARLSLTAAADSTFDLIILDAFSSDAIPVHLITREAIALYRQKLRPDGIILYHISNRYLDLRPVLVELARDAHLAGAIGDQDVNAEQRAKLYYSSRWVALSGEAATLAPLVRDRGWAVLPPAADVNLWTDDFSDVLGVMRWR